MIEDLRIPPQSKGDLTPPEVLAQRLSVLIGTPFPLTRKTRTDGSNARKTIAKTLERYPLPPPCPTDLYTIVPPKKKGVPRILREYLDTYIVTTGNSYNLQVWNRNPVGNGVQVEYLSGEVLRERDVRLILVRVKPDTQTICSIFVLSPEYVVAKFGKFGKPTIKHQIIITAKVREEILQKVPSILFYPDTPKLATMVTHRYEKPRGSIRNNPDVGRIFSLEILRVKIADHIIGAKLDEAATKNRGQALELLASQYLGYEPGEGEFLMGGYPDLLNQILEVKVQDSPTVDLGKFSPQFEESVFSHMGLTTSDVRYLITLTDERTGIVKGVILCPGIRLGDHFSYVSDVSYKCQRSIPTDFFDRYDGRAVFNP